ncbi:hypothetical protein LB465_15730 [Salegentibacter sp. LM13S]|uniref:hypothetical protein n=1 Tax=Salegentibacter lacus TaxID=2873599 RepID=UPI001CCA45A9|nr:hypothetical protein [Salegentibacter lacus]MBZ9632232.1 hypothetical protein [Salegentibacter lacus]
MKISFIVKLTFLLSAILFNGCDRNNEERTYRFIINNESGFDIRLEIFESGTNNFVKEIIISDSDHTIKNFQSTDMGQVYGIQDFFEGDSVNIIYGNNQKIQSYKCEFLKPENNGCSETGNIANDGDTQWKRERQGQLYIRTYTFNPENFEEATPCDGDCE